LLQKQAFLFAPSEAIRPIVPADIDYYLSRPAHELKIDILDAQGKLIRSFSSAPAKDPMGNSPNDPGFGAKPKSGAGALDASSGAHRFTWDLKYPCPTTFPSLVLRYAIAGEGPYAPPGKYSVRLTVDGQTQSQILKVERDPRLSDVTDADMQQQFALAMQLRDATDVANRTVIQIRAVDKALGATASGLDDPAMAAEAKAIETKLGALELDLYQVKNRSPRDTLNYPIKLNNQLATLGYLVDQGDHKPTDQDYAVFRQLSGELNTITAQVDAVLASDLAAYNQKLVGRHEAAITVPAR
jgi:hypothetical protein